MSATPETIIATINQAALNRGLDGAAWLAEPGNIPVTFDNGDILLFDDEGSRVYQVHVLFESRGRVAIDHVRQAFRTMFEIHQADLIFGMVPDFRRDVKLLARWTGCCFIGHRRTAEGLCELYVLSQDMWKGKLQ